jgi:diguanylate cyclase (GGDEF)-like protein
MEAAGAEAKQALRMRRFFMAVATYAACAVLAQACAWLGYLPSWLPAWWALGAAAVNAGFFAMLRSGRNMRLRDPSMTEVQLVVSMFAAMVLVSQADAARGALLMLLPVPLLFGVLRLNFRQMARVGLVGIAAYAAVIAVMAFKRPARVQPTLELLNLISLATVMGFVCLMCGYISKIRKDLAFAVATIGELADRDPLTGLFNRRNLMGRLEVEIARCHRQKRRGIALCMVDIDQFKRINDTFGHPLGDQVLTLVAHCLTDSVRVMDYVARYGGEEFVVLLEADSDEDALATCERIRARIEQLRIPGAPDLALSVSIGIAHFVSGESAASMMGRADKALYLAKAGGRNCIHADPGGKSLRQTTRLLSE